MQRIIRLISAFGVIGLLAGCDEPQSADPMAQLMRANAELQRQVDAQNRILFTLGAALILVGAALAVSLGVHWKKGGRSSIAKMDP